jgi:uncharacterized protein
VTQQGNGSAIQLATVLSFADLAVDALAGAREEIDALNVYPVPDGDTGTNLYLTMAAARDAARTAHRDGLERGDVLTAFTRGALLGARGNSGVILSEMLRAILQRIHAATDQERNAAVMVSALRAATQASYAAVGTPVEGTMLSVCRAAAEAAEALLDERADVRSRDVLTTSAHAAREALARTPEQLPVLRDAGVVDAGGRGVVVILDAAETALTGRRPPRVAGPRIPQVHGSEHAGGHEGHGLVAGGPAYEVMYLLEAPEVSTLRERLGALGDSLVVVGGEGLWNVHVHVDDVGAAIEAGIEAGRPHRIRVTHFAEQIAQQAARQQPPLGRAVVAVAAGPGLARLFEDAGAVVVRGGPGQRPSTGEILEALRGTGAEEVVVLPNDHDSLGSAQVAASTAESDLGIRVAVIPTAAQVEGLAAMAVHEPGRTFDQDVLEMTATARHTRQGAVTVAARAAMTMAGMCQPGDPLGVIAGDFVVVGEELTEVAVEVLRRLLGGGGELVTIVHGAEDPDGALARAAAAWVESQHPTVDVVVYDGGQERYPLLVSVE